MIRLAILEGEEMLRFRTGKDLYPYCAGCSNSAVTPVTHVIGCTIGDDPDVLDYSGRLYEGKTDQDVEKCPGFVSRDVEGGDVDPKTTYARRRVAVRVDWFDLDDTEQEAAGSVEANVISDFQLSKLPDSESLRRYSEMASNIGGQADQHRLTPKQTKRLWLYLTGMSDEEWRSMWEQAARRLLDEGVDLNPDHVPYEVTKQKTKKTRKAPKSASALPPGFEGFDSDDLFGDPSEAPKEEPNPVRSFENIVGGGYASLHDLRPLLRDPSLADAVGGVVYLVGYGSAGSWLVVVPTDDEKIARRTAERIRKNLKGLRNLSASQIGLHTSAPYVGMANGRVVPLTAKEAERATATMIKEVPSDPPLDDEMALVEGALVGEISDLDDEREIFEAFDDLGIDRLDDSSAFQLATQVLTQYRGGLIAMRVTPELVQHTLASYRESR